MDTMKERFTTPLSRRAMSPRLHAIRDHMRHDIGLALFPALAHHLDIYAAIWALLRESMIAGPGTRVDKEIVAAAVSMANRCSYCIAAHTTFLHAVSRHDVADAIWNDEPPRDRHHADLIRWAKDSARHATPPPFTLDDAPGIIGTAVTFHFVNRMVSSLMDENLLPGGLQRSRTVRRVAGGALGSTAKRHHQPGTAISHLGPARSPLAPAWSGTGPISEAYRALSAATRADDLLSPQAHQLIRGTVADLAGTRPSQGDWAEPILADLAPQERTAARIALLTATTGHHLTDDHIRQWRNGHTDADLVRLAATGAMVTVEPIAAALSTR
ncbi:AhpD family alkylhydroperoxidase [Stackebrandtia endophytica]|uniref:AhpD family alkylhydroperoxidase n=2 Tax=Stackebrandtia endophytica TaxID=1496996 RepID=A0A543APV4_9ACTN|nr:AhpD family alkylhydroperoxidase [Stackebrandtia endophytica]